MNLPNTLLSLGRESFAYCTSLTHITIPASIREWGIRVFESSALETVIFEEGLEQIGDYCFAGVKLKEIVFPESLKKIGEFAFGVCTELTSVRFNDGLEEIGASAFYQTGLKEVALPNGIQSLSSTFNRCKNLESVQLNSSLMTIGDGTFRNTNIKKLVVPQSVTEISESAFAKCVLLQKVYFEGNAPEMLEADRFDKSDCPDYIVYYHEGAEGFTSPEWNGYKTEIW